MSIEKIKPHVKCEYVWIDKYGIYIKKYLISAFLHSDATDVYQK